jgi:hypothetical protein
LGAKYLVVLCTGSALLLVEDESTSVVNGALVGVLLGQSASPSIVWLLLLRIDKPWFLTEGKPPNWMVLYIINTVPHQALFWHRCRGGKRRLLQGEFCTHILYFVLSFTLLYFYLHCFIKNTKKLLSFIVVISLL